MIAGILSANHPRRAIWKDVLIGIFVLALIADLLLWVAYPPSPSSFDGSFYASLSQGESYNYVIITTSAIENHSASLSSFIAHKQSLGYNVLVITEDEFGHFAGPAPDQRAEKIRTWLKAHYARLGIEYVLLIGDPAPNGSGECSIPMKMCWPEYPSYDAPTDYYYADLTGDWDYDGDGLYGEAWDDHGMAGGVDLNPEVLVGRIPVYDANYAALDNILLKIIDYENEPGNLNWRKNVLLPMTFIGPDWDGAELGEQMKDDFLSPNSFSCWRMYAPESSYKYEENLVAGENVANLWASEDYGIAVWHSHGYSRKAVTGYPGNWDGSLFHTSHCMLLDNKHPSFAVQLSCESGKPDDPDNLQYSLLKQGAIATLGATSIHHLQSYGYGDFDDAIPQPTCIAYQYVKRLTANEPAGDALYLAKGEIDILSDPSSSNLRNLYTFNLYGDPSASLFGRAQIASCDSEGNEKNYFAPGETVYAKGIGHLELGVSYKIWIQKDAVKEGEALISADDPSYSGNPSDMESVVTDVTGCFDPIAIWTVPRTGVSRCEYDIVADKQSSGAGTFNRADDGFDFVGGAGFTTSTVIYVDASADNSGDGSSWAKAYKELQSALDVADYGDEILVARGIYKPAVEHGGIGVRYKSFAMKNGVAIYGGFSGRETNRDQRNWERNVTTISGNIGNRSTDSDNSYHVIFNLNLNSTAVLDGFTIIGGNADGSHSERTDCGAGIYNYDSSPTISNCTFSENLAKYGGGIYNYTSSPVVSNCVFEGNTARYAEGIYNYYYSSPAITSCAFYGSERPDDGLYNLASKPVVTNCSFLH